MGGALSSLTKFKLGDAAAGVAVAAFAVKMTAASVKSAAAFEQGMARVQAVTGAVGRDWVSLQNKAKELGKTTKFTMVEIAGGMESLGRAGFKTNELIAAMGGVTALASSQMMSLAEAGQITANILRAMGLAAEDTNRVVNLLAATAASSNTTVASLGESFKMIAPLAHNLGVSVEELSAVIGELGNVGFQGTQATTVLSTALTRLAAPPKEAQDALDNLNMSIWDAQGNFIGLTNMIGLLEERFKGLTVQQQQAYLGQIFGARAVKQISSLIAVGSEKLREYTRDITDTNEAFDQQKKMLDTLSGQWTILQSSVEALQTAIGTKLIPALKDLVTAYTDVVNAMTDLISGNATFLDFVERMTKATLEISGLLDAIPPSARMYYGAEGEIKRLGDTIQWLTDHPFKGSEEAIKALQTQLDELQKKAHDTGISEMSDDALAAAVAFKSAAEGLKGLNTGLDKAGGLVSGISDFSLSGLLTDSGLSFLPTFPTITLQVNAGNVPEAVKTLEESLEELTVSMSADGIYKGLKALATTYPDSIDAIVAKGHELVDGMRTRAESLRALAGENQQMIAQAMSLESQAGMLESALGMTEASATSAAGALESAASAARSLASAASAMAITSLQDILPKVDQMVAELRSGQKPVEITLPAGEAGGGTVTGTAPLTLGETAENIAQLNALRSVVESTRTGLYRLGGASEDVYKSLDTTKEYLDSFTSGKTPEEIAAEQLRAQQEANAKAEKAARDAAAAQKKAATDAVRAAAEAAQEARKSFEAGFLAPIQDALSTGDWKGALEAVQGFAANRDELIQQAQALAAVNGETLTAADVMRDITGAYQQLGSALDTQIAVMKLAGEDVTALEDFKKALEAAAKGVPSALEKVKASDILSSPAETAARLSELAANDAVSVSEYTQSLISSIETEIQARQMFGMETAQTEEALKKFKKELAGDTGLKLSDIWAPLKSVLGNIKGTFGKLLTGSIDLAKAFIEGGFTMTNIVDAINFAVSIIAGFIQDQIDALKAKKKELEDTLAFYVDTFKRAAGVISGVFSLLGPLGDVLKATTLAFTSAIGMLTLSGIDLLKAGIETLTNYVSSMISAVIGLIQKSDAYQAVQEQGARAWKAVSDLLGQFLWPLAALMKQIMDWLGIQEKVNETAAVEIGVPSSWKRAARAYEAAMPGQVFTEASSSATAIPEWATELVSGIASAIEGVLKKFGISSWSDLLQRFKEGSIKFWNYVTTKIPDLVSSLTSILNTLSDAIGGGIVDTIVAWLEKGFDWLIHEAPGIVQKIVDFSQLLWQNVVGVWNWLKSQDWKKIWQDIQDKFAEFQKTLNGLGDFTGIETEIGKVTSAIASLERTMKYVIAIAAGAIIGGIGGALAPLTFGGSVLGAQLGAALGAGIGLLIAGMFREGGIIPGPIGSPQLIVGHGGEAVLTREQQSLLASPSYTEVHVYLGQEEVSDLVIERIQRVGKLVTGRRSGTAALTRRYA